MQICRNLCYFCGMNPQLEQLRTSLGNHGLSMTNPRKLVFEVLFNSGPMTMHELISACESYIDRASVYRTVLVFEKLSIIHRIQIAWKYRIELSDDYQRHHHHMHCTLCDKLIAMPEDPILEGRLLAMAMDMRFAVSDHSLEVRGVCAACQQANV